MRVDNSTGKGTSSMDKFSIKVHGVHMELGCKLFYSLRIKTQFLERLQSVSVVDGAIHNQKDDVESNGGSLENVAEVFVLFLCGVQLVLSSCVLTVLDLDRWMSRRGLLRSLGRCCLGLVALLVASALSFKEPPLPSTLHTILLGVGCHLQHSYTGAFQESGSWLPKS